MNLYLVVISWGHFDETQEAEWFHFVAKEYEYDEVEKQAIKYLVDNAGAEEEDIEIDELWINKIDEVGDYDIKLIKKVK